MLHFHAFSGVLVQQENAPAAAWYSIIFCVRFFRA
jgi:hypothetical protein